MAAKTARSTARDTSTPSSPSAAKDVVSLQVSLPQMLDLALGTPEVKKHLPSLSSSLDETTDKERLKVSRGASSPRYRLRLGWSGESEHPAQFPSHPAASDKPAID